MKTISKKGQLGIIEGKFFLIGFFVGLILSLVLVMLGTKKILPFKIPLVCGTALFSDKFLKNKKAQLIAIEFHFFMGGLAVGIVLGLVLVWLGTTGVLPFAVPLVCG